MENQNEKRRKGTNKRTSGLITILSTCRGEYSLSQKKIVRNQPENQSQTIVPV